MLAKETSHSVESLRRERVDPTKELLAESLVESLPMKQRIDDRLRPLGNNKKDLVGAYTQSRHYLERQQGQLATFMKHVVELNTHIYADPPRRADAERLKKQARKELPYFEWSYEPLDLLSADAMANGPEALREMMLESLTADCRRLTSEFFGVLRDAVDRNELGMILWHSDSADVCVYNYFRTVISVDRIARRYRTRTEQKTAGNRFEVWEIKDKHETYKEKIVYERHEHHLYDSRIWTWPANGLQKPPYITALLRQVPRWLQPHIFTVSGEMCREEIKVTSLWERQFEEESNVFAKLVASGNLISPAVIISDIVLAGWADRDLQIRQGF